MNTGTPDGRPGRACVVIGAQSRSLDPGKGVTFGRIAEDAQRMAVSKPVRWKELSDLPGDDAWNVRNAIKRLRALKSDPWADTTRPRSSG